MACFLPEKPRSRLIAQAMEPESPLQSPPNSLESLLADVREPVRREAAHVAGLLKHDVAYDQLIKKPVSQLMQSFVDVRWQLPNHSSQFSIVDRTLIPIMELHRTLQLAQPMEEQLEPSELDLMAFGIIPSEQSTNYVRVRVGDSYEGSAWLIPKVHTMTSTFLEWITC